MAAHTLNGINVEELSKTVEALKADPELAKFRFSASNKWTKGTQNQTTVKGFYGAGEEHRSQVAPFVLKADEPRILQGEDTEPNPVEHLLNALAGCLTTSLVAHAAVRGIKIEEVESTLEGDIDLQGFLGLSKDVRKGYQNIRVRFRVKSDAPEEQLQELCRFSPVFDTVSNGVPVSIDFEKK